MSRSTREIEIKLPFPTAEEAVLRRGDLRIVGPRQGRHPAEPPGRRRGDDLLRRADAALYEAKQAGRDRVVFR